MSALVKLRSGQVVEASGDLVDATWLKECAHLVSDASDALQEPLQRITIRLGDKTVIITPTGDTCSVKASS